MSRARSAHFLAVLAASALAVGLVACGGEGGSDESADRLLDGATLQGIESADLDLSLDARSSGKEGGNVEVRISGPFQGAGKGELPQLAVTATAQGKTAGDGAEIDFEGGLVLLPNSAYVNFEGVEYEVDPTTFSFVESALRRSERESGVAGEGEGASACQEAAGEIEVAKFVDNAESNGSVEVGGAETTKVSGELDVGGAIDAGIELAQSPACSTQVAAAGELPSDAEVEEAKEEVEDTVEAAKVDVYVGDDDIVRRLAAELTLDPRDGTGTTTIEFDLRLSGVNEEQEIAAPAGPTKPLSDLFIKLRINPIELLGLLQGESGGADLGSLLEGLGDSAR